MTTYPATVQACVCDRCGHPWVPRAVAESKSKGQAPEVVQVLPTHCARCNSPYWNTPRKR